MEKERQVKLLSIVALVLAISAMTLGFAAFSTTLNISSSATVTPNATDFKIKAYGLAEGTTEETFIEKSTDTSIYSSETSGYYVFGGNWNDSSGPVSATSAVINNKTFTINNLSAVFSEPNQDVTYPFIIKNEGNYTAYFKASELGDYLGGVEPLSCQAAENTSENLVSSACNSIVIAMSYVDPSGNSSDIGTEDIKLNPGEHMLLAVQIVYLSGDARADGPFSVSFDDIKLNFSTVNN